MENIEERGRLLYRHWRRNTLREVYADDKGRVTKRFWVRPGTWRYPKPWLREDAALSRLESLRGMPRSYGVTEREFERGHEAIFVRDYVEGSELDHVEASEAEEIGELLAMIHRKGVVIDDAAIDNFIKTDTGRIVCIDFGCAHVFGKHDPRLFYAVGEELAKLKRRALHERDDLWDVFCREYFAKTAWGVLARGVIWCGYGVARSTRWLRKEFFGRESRRFRYYRERYGLEKPPREKRYEQGRLFVRPGLDCREKIEGYIFKMRFADQPSQGDLSGKAEYSFYLPEAERNVVLQVVEVCGGWRAVKLRLFNTAKKAFFGALALEKIGVHTVSALAYWSRRAPGGRGQSWFLYEQASDAISSVADLRTGVELHPTPEGARMLDAIIDRIADVMRRIHGCGLRHTATTLPDFMIEEGDITAPESDPARRYNVVMQGTDRIGFSRGCWSALRMVFNLRDLAGMDFGEAGGRRFLQRYLGQAYSRKWWRVYLFWQRNGRHPGWTMLKRLFGSGGEDAER
jgi:hypothetical protein